MNSDAQPRWWQWPTVLSLDAPAIAVLWQRLLAQTAGVRLTHGHAFVLGVSTWLAYAADRWIEGWRLAPDQVQTQRHAFYQRHRLAVAVIWILVLCADLAVAFTQLSVREFDAGLILMAPVFMYLLSHQLVHRHHPLRAPKEICVAALLGAGVAVFIVAQPGAQWVPLAAPLVLFMLLCFANCMLISVWERHVDKTHGQTSLALQFRGSDRAGRLLPWAIALGSAGAIAGLTGTVRTVASCAAATAVLFGIVDRLESRIGWRLARVMVDAAMLTPIVPLLVLRPLR